LVNAVPNHFWPAQLFANPLGLLAAFLLSLLAGLWVNLFHVLPALIEVLHPKKDLNFAQGRPWHDQFHGFQEFVAPGGLAVLLNVSTPLRRGT